MKVLSDFKLKTQASNSKLIVSSPSSDLTIKSKQGLLLGSSYQQDLIIVAKPSSTFSSILGLFFSSPTLIYSSWMFRPLKAYFWCSTSQAIIPKA